MKKYLIFLYLLVAVIVWGCTGRVKFSAEHRIEEKIEDYIDKWGYNLGVCVAVYSSSLNMSYDFVDGCFSLDSKEKIMKNTPHILYSITKSFTASVVIQLVGEGKLLYGDKVSDYLTGLNGIYINMDATISELLSHRSGIFDYTDNAALFYDNPFANGGEWKAAKILDYIETPAVDRDADSGKYLFKYSSANYILLGMIAEKIIGKSLNEYIYENFLSQLGLSLLLTPQDEVDFSKICHPHIYPNTAPFHLAGDGKTPIDVTTVISDVTELSAKCSWAAGGMVGCASDVAKWGYELLSENGGIDESIRNSILDSVAEFDSSVREAEAYGYGVRKLFYNGYELIGSYGRSIGDENLMFYNKDKDVCICILTNSNTMSNGNPNIDELMYAIFDEL